MVNPPITLKGGPPRAALLDPADGKDFSVCLQAALLAANSIAGHYPAVRTAPALEAVRRSPHGQLVVAHLTAVAYSYWAAAPAGPGVCALAARHLVPPLDAVCRDECGGWGGSRLNSPVDAPLVLVAETDGGTVVADAGGGTFYVVAGLTSSPAAAAARAGATLPVQVRLTALPFRGVLVYDGLLGGPLVPLGGAPKVRLLAAYEAAAAAGALVTGLAVPASAAAAGAGAGAAAPPPPPVPTDDLRAMSVRSLKAHLAAAGASTVGCVEKGDLLALAVATRAADAAAAADAAGGWTHPDGTFKQLCAEGDLSPAEAAAVATLRALPRRPQAGLIFRRWDGAGGGGAAPAANLVMVMGDGGAIVGMFSTAAPVPTVGELLPQLVRAASDLGALPGGLSVDDLGAAAALDRVTRHVRVHTGYYPQASVEERAFLAAVPPQQLAAVEAQYGGGG